MDNSIYTSDESSDVEKESSFDWNNTSVNGEDLQRLEGKKRRLSSLVSKLSKRKRISTRGPSDSGRAGGSNGAEDGNSRPSSSASGRASAAASRNRESVNENIEAGPGDRIRRDRVVSGTRIRNSLTRIAGHRTRRLGEGSSMASSASSSLKRKTIQKDSAALSDSESELESDTFDMNRTDIDGKALEKAQAGKKPEFKVPLISRGRRSTNTREVIPVDDSSSDDEGSSKSFDMNNSYINPEDLMKAQSQPDRVVRPLRQLRKLRSPVRISEKRKSLSPIPATGSAESADSENVHGDSDKSETDKDVGSSRVVMSETVQPHSSHAAVVGSSAINQDETDIIFSSDGGDTDKENEERTNVAENLQNVTRHTGIAGSMENVEARRDASIPNRTLNDPTVTLADVVVSENDRSFGSSLEGTFTNSTATRTRVEEENGEKSSDDITRTMTSGNCSNDDDDIGDVPLVQLPSARDVSVQQHHQPAPAAHRISTPFPHTVAPFVKPLPQPTAIIPNGNETRKSSKSIFLQSSRSLESSKTVFGDNIDKEEELPDLNKVDADKTRTAPSPSATRPASFSGNYIPSNSIPDPDASVRRKLFKSVGEVSGSSITGNPAEKRTSSGRTPASALGTPTPQTQLLVSPRRSPRKIVHPTNSNPGPAGNVGKQRVPTRRPTSKKSSQTYDNEKRKSGPQVFSSSSVEENDVQEDVNTASAPSTSSGMSKHFKHHSSSSKESQNMVLGDKIAIEGNRSDRRSLITHEKRSSFVSSPKSVSSTSHRSSVVGSRIQIEEIIAPRRSPRKISLYKSVSNPASTGGKKSKVTGASTVKPSTTTGINDTRPSEEGSQDRLFSSSSVEENDSHEQRALTSVPLARSRRSKRLEHLSNRNTEEPQSELFGEETVTEDNQSKRRSLASHEKRPSVVSQIKSRSSTLGRNSAVHLMSSNAQTEEALLPRRSPRKTPIASKSIAYPTTSVEKQPRKIGRPTDEKSDERRPNQTRTTASGSQAKLVSFSGEHEDKNEQQTSTSVPSTPLRRSTRFENQSSHMSDSPGMFLEKQAIGGDQSKQKSPASKSSMGSVYKRRKLMGTRQEISISSGASSDSEDQSMHPGNRNISPSVSNREASVIRESSRPFQPSRTSELNLNNAHSGQSDVPGPPSPRAADLSVSGKHGPKKDMPTFLDLLRAALDKQKNNPSDGPCLTSEQINVCPLASQPATAKWTKVKSANVQPVVRVNKATTDAFIQAILDSRSRSKDVVSIQKRTSHASASVKRTPPRSTSQKSQIKVRKRRQLSVASSSSEEEKTAVRKQGKASFQQRQFNVNTRKEQQNDSDDDMSHNGVEENSSGAVVEDLELIEDHSDVYRRHSKKASAEEGDLESADDSDQERASRDGANSDGGSENRLTDEEDNENETNDKPEGGTVSGEEESLEGNAEVVSVGGSDAEVDSADNGLLDDEESEPEPNDQPERGVVGAEVDEEEQEDSVEKNVELVSEDESENSADGTENRVRDEEESEPELNDQPGSRVVDVDEDEEEQEDFVEENVEVVSVDGSGDSDDGTENRVRDEEESEPELNDHPGSDILGVDEDEVEQEDFVEENAEIVSVDESGDGDDGPESGVRDDEESEPELNDQPGSGVVGVDEDDEEDFVEENAKVVSLDDSGDSGDGTQNGVSDEEESEPDLNDQPGSGLVSTVDKEHEEYTEENVEVASVDRSDVDADTTQTHRNDEDSEPETNGYGSDIEEVQHEEIEENVERVSGHLHDENDVSEAEDEEIGTRSLPNKKTKGISRRSSIAKSALSDASDSEAGAERNTSDRLSSRSSERDQIASQSRKSSSSETSVKKVAVKPGKRKVSSTHREKSSSQSSSRSQSPGSRRGVNEKTPKHISVSLPKGNVAGSSRKQRGEHHVVLDGENGRNAKYVSRATLRHMLHTRMETFPLKGLTDLLNRINGELQTLFNKLEAQNPNGIFTANELEQELMNLDLIPKQRGILFFMLEQYTERSAFSKLRKSFLP